MTYEIEKGRPLPPVPNKMTEQTFPFASMEIGDRISIPDLNQNPPVHLKDKAKTLGNLRSHVSRANKRYPDRSFYVTVDPENSNFLVIWRQS